MNSEFEKRLQQQPLRQLPSEWKKDILDVAAQSVQSTELQSTSTWWRELLWPCPQAWGALAAVWMIICGLEFASREPGAPQIQVADASAPTVFALYRENQLIAESSGHSTAPTPPAEPRKYFVPRPRSEIRITIVV